MTQDTDSDTADISIQILEISGLLFRGYSLKSLQLKDIIQKSKIPRNIFLQYYTDKNELIHAVFDYKIEKTKERLLEIHAHKEKTALEIALEGRVIIMEMIEDFPEKVIYELKKYYPDLYEKWNDFKETWMVQLAVRNIQLGISQHIYRPSINVELISSYLVKNFMQNCLVPPATSTKFPDVEIRNQIAEFELSAICTDEGRALLRKLIGG